MFPPLSLSCSRIPVVEGPDRIMEQYGALSPRIRLVGVKSNDTLSAGEGVGQWARMLFQSVVATTKDHEHCSPMTWEFVCKEGGGRAVWKWEWGTRRTARSPPGPMEQVRAERDDRQAALQRAAEESQLLSEKMRESLGKFRCLMEV